MLSKGLIGMKYEMGVFNIWCDSSFEYIRGKTENGSRDGGFTAKLFQNRIAQQFQSSREILLD